MSNVSLGTNPNITIGQSVSPKSNYQTPTGQSASSFAQTLKTLQELQSLETMQMLSSDSGLNPSSSVSADPLLSSANDPLLSASNSLLASASNPLLSSANPAAGGASSTMQYIVDAFLTEFLNDASGTASLPGITGDSSGSSTGSSIGISNGLTNASFTSGQPGTTGALSASELNDVAVSAAQIAGVPSSWTDTLVKIAMNESSGNPTAVNGQLTGDDEHAVGLMQTEPTTFQAYAAPGHTDITNPLDNMVAAINYIKSRYGDPNVALTRSLNGGY